jgi:hypothetical protein
MTSNQTRYVKGKVVMNYGSVPLSFPAGIVGGVATGQWTLATIAVVLVTGGAFLIRRGFRRTKTPLDA